MARSDNPQLLRDTRVYLSGPMDFVASRANEKQHGWRHRLSDFLRQMGVIVFDPWFKPEVRGLHEYGREGDTTDQDRDRWSFEPAEAGERARAWCVEKYWQTMHIDLRMVDTSDFVISYCPTNIYSVGTPHEIILCRQEHKPVLFVSPPVDFPALDQLKAHLASSGDETGSGLLEQVVAEAPIKPNPRGIPSLWYMPLVGADNFFDGFGFAAYNERFNWPEIALDAHEARFEIKRPLLPYLERLNRQLPQRWDNERERHVPDDDWILWDLATDSSAGARLSEIQQAKDVADARR
jgi:hypothetical protein